MRYLFLLSLVLCPVWSFADDEAARLQIQQWIQQLGDESFIVRERAETLLIRAGMKAYPDLQRAKQSRDIEVARRADHVLSHIEQNITDVEDEHIAARIQAYRTAPDLATKVRNIWFLADPHPIPRDGSGFTKGEGLPTLCRMVRFEEKQTLRLEAAKCLIASPPHSLIQRQNWFQYIRDNLRNVGDDELLQHLAHFTNLWCDLDDAEMKTTPEFQERVRQISAVTLRFLEKQETKIQANSVIDLLLHYAIAEMQDAVGLTEECEKILEAVIALESEPLPPTNGDIGILENNLLIFEHWYVGYWLRQRHRLHWAIPHFQKVIETGDISLRVKASEEAALTAIDLADYPSAIAFFEKHIEILESPEYISPNVDPKSLVTLTRRQIAYCQAKKAFDQKDWEGVRKAIEQALSSPDVEVSLSDIDLVILFYVFCKQQPEIDGEFKKKMELALKQTWQSLASFHRNLLEQNKLEGIPNIYNSAAWLLANTDGDYQTALTFVEVALKDEPDRLMYLNTLAHVYFLGGKIDEAIRTQERVVRMAPDVVIFRQVLERFK